MFRKSLQYATVAVFLTACSVEQTHTPAAPIPEPTTVETHVSPSPVASTVISVATPATPGETQTVNGQWRYLATGDGLCTDWPLFIGGLWIGTGGTTMCRITSLGEVVTSPDGTRILAANQFPPNGGLEIATEKSICPRPFDEWHCAERVAEVSMQGVHQLLPLDVEPVYRFDDRVMLASGNVYDLKAIADAPDVRSTWMAISGSRQGGASPEAELWVGTEHHGLVVIDLVTGGTRRYVAGRDLLSNEIRDVQAEQCPKMCDYRDIWVATSGGVANWNGAEWRTYTSENGLPSNDVRGIAIFGRDDVWAATDSGVAHFDGRRWEIIDQGIPETDLTGVIQVDNKTVGFGTRGHGILIFEFER